MNWDYQKKHVSNKIASSIFALNQIKNFLPLLQGGQNFFEPIRTKIRTFSEAIRTIRTIFENKSVQSVQFFFKKIRTIRTFF